MLTKLFANLLSKFNKIERNFDAKFYLRNYPDVQTSPANAWNHYRNFGWKEGRNPSSNFNTAWYLHSHPVARASGANPLSFHNELRSNANTTTQPPNGNLEWMAVALSEQKLAPTLLQYLENYFLVSSSEQFDVDFYTNTHEFAAFDAIEHFIRFGGPAGMDPGTTFDSLWYRERYSDVKAAGQIPFIHYLRHGRTERRFPNPESEKDAKLADPICSQIIDRGALACADIQRRMQVPALMASIDGPLISILTPVYDVAEVWLRQMITSVLNQTYENWELCLVDDASTYPFIRDILLEFQERDARIKIKFREINGGISMATNDCLELSTGRYVALVDNDDIITCDALEEMVKAIINNNCPDWLYSDECKINENNIPSQLFAKPDWSPLLLLNYMYTGHLSLYKRDIVLSVGGFRSDYDFSQDYDLALRVSEATSDIVHVGSYLYCWRMISTSGSVGGKPGARISNVAALQSAIDRRGWSGTAQALETANRAALAVNVKLKTSIIIPSDSGENISLSLNSIISKTGYSNYELVVVTNSKLIEKLRREEAFDSVVWRPYDKPFNFSDKCNVGATAASGEYLIFFNDDVRVISSDWIESLLEFNTLPGVGVVAPKLLYEDGSIQHAGMVTGVRRLVGTAFHSYPEMTGAHFNFAQCVREVSLVCGALFSIKRTLFEEISGFDAENVPINHSDVDLCFRVRERGLTCVYTPHTTLLHIGHSSIALAEKTPKVFRSDKADIFLLRRWGEFVARDPYFPPPMRDLIFVDSPEEFQLFNSRTSSGSKDVLIVSHDLTGSGAPKVVYDMALELQRAGYYVIVSSPVDGVFRNRLNDKGISVIIDALATSGHESINSFAKNFDVVVANTIVSWRIVADVSRYTTVFAYVHETELVTHFANINADFVEGLNSAAAIWCGSDRSKIALKEVGLNAEILEYGVDDISLKPVRKKIKISLFGSYEPRKGQDLAVLGMLGLSQEARKSASLTLYGRTLDTHFRQAIELIAKDIPQVEICGELDYDSYLDALNAADIVIVCSRDDTLPLVSLDALALGKPLICSTTTGTSAYLSDRVSALILQENHPAEITQALTALLTDSAFRKKVGLGGKRAFEKHFTHGAFRRRLLAQVEGHAN